MRIVKDYIQDFPEEFRIVKKGIAAKRLLTRNEFANLEGSDYSRALYEISETLSNLFITRLNEEQMVWFKTKEGARWFAREFQAFALPFSI